VGTPFCPLMEIGALPLFEEHMVLDISRLLGFHRDFLKGALVALFLFYYLAYCLLSLIEL
jgi:hypothetical protein